MYPFTRIRFLSFAAASAIAALAATNTSTRADELPQNLGARRAQRHDPHDVWQQAGNSVLRG